MSQLIIAILGGEELQQDYSTVCQAVGFSIQYFFLAAFCWMSSMFNILLLGFAFDCWIGKLGLGAADTLVFYFAVKGVGYTCFIASEGGDGGFGVTVSSFEMPAAAIFSL